MNHSFARAIPVIAIAGNPNSGKTALFNAMTGARQHVGNWPGVTVEKKEGRVTRGGKSALVVDLPGTYSLGSQALDETIARDFITHERPDVVINVVDSTNLERNLYLTTQLLDLGVPLVLALNMFDEVKALGIDIDVEALSRALRVNVVPTVAVRSRGIDELLDAAFAAIDAHTRPTTPVTLITAAVPDTGNIETCDLAAEHRYKLAAEITQSVIRTTTDVPAESPSQRIDRIALNKWLAYPIFFGVVWAMFQFTFTLSEPIALWLGGAIGTFGSWVSRMLGATGAPEMVVAFLADGVFAGLGALLEFAPPIFLLFFAISFLEDIGYMARAALISDRLMGAVGLHGKAFIPMILGFGCNVTGILAARSLDSRRDRLVSILVNPLISCSARLPVYVLFAGAFFAERRGLVVFSLYALGVVLAALAAKVLSVFIKPDVSSTFVMELPPYRMPRISGVLLQTWERGREFLHKAGTVILLAVVVVWVLSNLPPGVDPGSPESLIGRIGSAIAPLLKPAGFGTWQAASALVFGAIAKELIVGTLGVLYGSGVGSASGGSGLINAIQANWTPLSAYAFMVMSLVYMPCVATLAAIRRETGSRAWTAFAMAYPLVLGWVLAVIVYQVGRLIGLA
ncbi:MAG TPA: ferrous iron transport protein B [Bacillota bacterium]|jgi:ferrous iron transport protein B|nr:ferrous iron transport protein B [Bacillota bacterium]HNY68186.1 ferrous iron transport protein B [Bacillota bacterium]HPU75381.1 ferrous iron transport protein B [Bacillota bacterium]